MEHFITELKDHFLQNSIQFKLFNHDIVVYDLDENASLCIVEDICKRHDMFFQIVCKNVTELTYTFWYNACLKCGINMGIHNPRQLCGKYRCYNA